jgi:hypothetical protein
MKRKRENRNPYKMFLSILLLVSDIYKKYIAASRKVEQIKSGSISTVENSVNGLNAKRNAASIPTPFLILFPKR